MNMELVKSYDKKGFPEVIMKNITKRRLVIGLIAIVVVASEAVIREGIFTVFIPCPN